MKTILKATVPFLLSTTLTGISCYVSGLPRPDIIVALSVAAAVSGTVAYGAAILGSRRVRQDSDPA